MHEHILLPYKLNLGLSMRIKEEPQLSYVMPHNIIDKISQMLQKTEMSQVSTNAQQKTTSFFTSRNRQMYRQLKKNEPLPKDSPLAMISKTHLPNDLLLFNPILINALAWPEIFSFQNDLKANVKGNYYEISGLRGNKKFLPRKSEANAELIYFDAEKPTRKINLITIERFIRQGKDREELWLHFNISKFDPEEITSESSDFYLLSEGQSEGKHHQIWDFCSFHTIENCKKGLVVLRVCNLSEESQSHYKILLVDLIERGLKKHQIDEKKLKVFCSIQLDCEINFGRQNQRFLKTIKSEFGDIVLMITNREIYEVEVEQIGQGYKLSLKVYKVSKLIAGTKQNYRKSEHKIGQESDRKGISNKQEQIVDAQFMSNGLKIMILTNYQQVIIIEAHNFQFSQGIVDAFIVAQLEQKYDLGAIVCTKLYPINGSVALQFHTKNEANLIKKSSQSVLGQIDKQQKLELVTKGIILLKVQNNSLSFMKMINLQIQQKDIYYLTIRECSDADQILVQYIEKTNPYLMSVIKCRILMGELNAITKMDDLQYNYSKIVNFKTQNEKILMLNHFHPIEPEKKYSFVDMPLSSRVVFMLNDKELVCYKIFNEIDSQKINKSISKLFTHSFFEKPLKITVSPLTMHFAIIFKQFVKFFYFSYSSVKNYYTLKTKNINDIQYVGQGQKMLISCDDGMIFLVDSYNFREEKILEFYGQPIESKMIDQKHMTIRSSKNTLSFYERGWDQSQNRSVFEKQYEIKLEENDQYYTTLEHLVVFRKNAVAEVYAHNPKPIPSDLPEAQRECFQNLREIHKHMINRNVCSSFQVDEVATKILLSQQLGFLFVATNRGNLKQYLWPLQRPSNPNPPEVLTQQISSHKIMSLFIDAKFTCLYAASENGSIAQLQINQYINGEKMPYVYLFSEKTKNDEQQKREFTDRSYFIDNCTPTELSLTQASQQNIEELQFFVDKLKDDIEEMTKNLLIRGKETESNLKITTKQNQKEFKVNLKDQQAQFRLKLTELRSMIELNEKTFEIEKGKEVEIYQNKLLDLYRQSDRLKSILVTQDKRLSEERDAFKKEYAIAMKQLNAEKTEELIVLQKQYKAIELRKRLSEKQNEIEDREQEMEMKLFKAKIHEQEQEQLNKAEQAKQGLLGDNTKREKQILNLKNRANYFQNLILQTKVQITELLRDQEEYERKKEYLHDELKEKEEIIEKIERELVQYLKNTEDMKTIKNNHEFELEQYEQEVTPIQENFKHIEDNVKHMNMEIMKEYNLKVEKTQLIKEQLDLVNMFKEKKKQLMLKKLELEGRFKRLAEKLTYLAKHPFDGDIKGELQSLLNQNSKADEVFKMDEAREKEKREAERLMRYKNMIRKEIEEEQKREEHIIKNQHEFYKYHVENTTLVREFNELRKTQKYLSDEQNKLEEKLNLIRATRMQTPLRRVPSLNIRKGIDKKLTPFQRYEQEQQTLNVRKNQDTSDTRLSRNSQSLSFLKGLMKEVNQTDSKYEKLEVMRERVRTFVNPELKIKRNEDIKKILFGRVRGTSEMLKLK